MAIETPVRPDVVPPRSTDPLKKRAKRLGTVTVSLLALLALGISLAYFLQTEEYADNEATGGELVIEAVGLPLTAQNLFPTSASDGGTNAHEEPFSINNDNPAPVSYTMTAKCENCSGNPGNNPTVEDQQWEHLYISIKDSNGTVLYSGRLADMRDGYQGVPGNALRPASGGAVKFGTVPAESASTYTARVWLKESGAEQPQAVISDWAFDLKGKSESS